MICTRAPLITANIPMMPRLTGGEDDFAAQALGVELFGKYALRKGDWKLLVMPPPYASGEAELYNIARDPGESNNLASEEPERVAELQALWEDYVKANGVILPDWVSGY